MEDKQKGPVENQALISFRRHVSVPGRPMRRGASLAGFTPPPREAASQGLVPAVMPTGSIAVRVPVITVIGTIAVTISIVAIIRPRTHINAEAGAPTAAPISATPTGVGSRRGERNRGQGHSRG